MSAKYFMSFSDKEVIEQQFLEEDSAAVVGGAGVNPLEDGVGKADFTEIGLMTRSSRTAGDAATLLK
jgi:hypothetical protein